ncbi:histidine kinase [Pseudoduganella lurida]|uniref:Histidine kinase n=1 Tax=Pseudoduganella lurida TaxID=1036180 RepID=A0A562RKC8_9BURK|nr:triple tyrosine motif-containing protein [Pseudoduganella lurida]TWI69499.1 histidine kinase [Pseudoduganella lurida]
MRTIVIRLFLRWIVLAAACAALPAHALDPAIGIEGYRHDRWGETDGAPRLIDALAQTEDGWLWVASRQSGLYRFDGVRFLHYETRDGSRLQNIGISAMRPGPGNALWMGHGAGGVSVLRDGRLKHVLLPAQTASVYAIATVPDGTTWIASALGLFRIRDDVPVRMGAAQGYPGQQAQYVLADRAGRVWVADDGNLTVLEPGAAAFRQVRRTLPDPMLVEAPNGSVWLVLGKEFTQLAPAADRRPAPPSFGTASSFQSGFDGDGNLWSGNCPVGLCVLRPGDWQGRAAFSAMGGNERLDQPWQLTSLTILSVMVDREGSLWVGTPAGLERLRDQPVHMVGELLDRGKVFALPHPDGSMLVLEARRLNGALTLWRMEGSRLVAQPNPLNAAVMSRAPDGSLVLGGSGGIERHRAAGVERIPLPPVPARAGTLALRDLIAGNDELWAWVAGHGVWQYRGGRWLQPDPRGKGVIAVAFDAAGRSYRGYAANHLVIADGEKVRELGAAEGLDVGRMRFILPAETLLVSGDRGAALLHDGRFQPLQTSVPAGLGLISGIVSGRDGTRWLNTANGMFRVAAADWARTMADPRVPLRGTLLDALDGYLGGAESTWLTNTLFMGADGRLWFVGERGLAWLDPRAVTPNPATPDVELLAFTANGQRRRPADRNDLGTGAADLAIDYTAPSLRMPQRVTFRYRLLGADAAWEDAGPRRTAFYKHLGPGDYTFEVVAVNESGVPSRRAATLHFHVAPRLTQTAWFQVACALALLAAIALAWRVRMRRLAARLEDRFQVRVRERESIARSLHDTFLQSVQGLLLSMQSVTMKLPADSTARGEFDALLERAERVLVEGRDEVKGLRGEFASSVDFWQVLQRDVGLVIPRAAARLSLLRPEAVDRLHAPLRHDVYAIAREAITNALRHTAGNVTVECHAGPKAFTLCVADAGAGLGAFRHGKAGHFGLTGMRERAAQIGARLQIEDGEGGGTRVLLTVPASLAYPEDAAAQAGL